MAARLLEQTQQTILTWDGAILAGGRNRRLGGCDKALLPLGSVRVIERLAGAMHPLVRDLVVVTNTPDRYAELGFRAVRDRVPGRGALAGIDAALAATGASHLLIVACDMPFLHADFLAELQDAGRDAQMAVARTAGGQYPVCTSIARTCHETVRHQLGAGRLSFRELLGSLQVQELGPDVIARHDPHGVLLLNVNTPFDYGRALALCAPDWRASCPHDMP